jgi:hypothetical protein
MEGRIRKEMLLTLHLNIANDWHVILFVPWFTIALGRNIEREKEDQDKEGKHEKVFVLFTLHLNIHPCDWHFLHRRKWLH